MCKRKPTIVFFNLVLLLLCSSFSAFSQCQTTSYTYVQGGQVITKEYNRFYFSSATSGTTYTYIHNGATQQEAPYLISYNAGCVTKIINGTPVVKNVDVRIDVLNVLADGSPSPVPGYGPTKFSNPVNGTVQFNGNGYQFYKFTMSFFENGTNIPINVDVFQQILDIDGDGDFNNDFSVDDIRAHGLPSLVDQVMDDYIKINTADFDNFETSSNSFVYTKQASGVTSFYSSGTDNPNVGGYGVSYSGIAGFLSPAMGSET